MKLKKVKELLNAKIIAGEAHLENEVFRAFGCDLMSDILRFAKEDSLLLTGLVNNQVLNTADLSNMNSIVFVRGKSLLDDMLELAEDINILIMTTEYTMFECCGILYNNGMKGARYD